MTNEQRFVTIKHMFSLWWLIKYLVNYSNPNTASLKWLNSEVSRNAFVNYLVFERHFREDYRDTILRWWYGFGGRQIPSSHSGLSRAKKQRKDIDNLINRGKDLGLISSKDTPSLILETNWKTENFLRFFPFLNSLLKEYGYIYTFVFGIVGGGVLLKYIGEFINLIIKTISTILG